MMLPEIEALGLTWKTKAEPIQTARGLRKLHSAPLGNCKGFWSLFRADKERLQSYGYAPNKDMSGNWVLNQWEPVEGFAIQAPEPAAPRDEMVDTSHIDTTGLLPWQAQSVARLVKAITDHGAALDASDMGTGKTYTALATAKHLGLGVLVVCPLAVIPSWHRAAKHFGLEIRAVNYEKVRTGNTDYGSWGEGKKQFVWEGLGTKDLIIFDEVHRCKSQTSQNSKLLIGATRQDIKTLSLSATAFTTPLEMKALGSALGLFLVTKYYAWAFRHGCQKGRWGGLEYTGGKAVLKEIHADIFPNRGVRIKIADLGDLFPENNVSPRVVWVSEAGGKRINAAIEEAREVIMRVRMKEARDGDSILTAILRARQISEAEKIPAVADMIADGVEQGQSVAVFVNFQDSVDALSKALTDGGMPHSTLTGQHTDEEKEAQVAAFQANTVRVIVCNIAAGGVGISLHDMHGGHPRYGIVFPSFAPVDFRQALGRLPRAGAKSKVVQHIVFAGGTIEEDVLDKVNVKLDNLDTLNDGDLI